MNKLFIRYTELAKKAEIKRGTKESLEWFRTVIRKGRAVDIGRVTEGFKKERISPGKLFAYTYDPKTKDRLPYYDTTPLIIVLDITKDGWYGANLHYLPPTIRAKLLSELNYNSKNLGQIKRSLENSSITKGCLKRYLASQIVTKPISIPKDLWEICIQLPFESFVKASKARVWKETKKKI